MPNLARDVGAGFMGVRSLSSVAGGGRRAYTDLEDCEHADLDGEGAPERISAVLKLTQVDLSGSDNGLGQARSTVLRRVLALCLGCAAAALLVSTSRSSSALQQDKADSHSTLGLHENRSHDPGDWGMTAVYIRGARGLCLDSWQRVHMELCNADRLSQQWTLSPSTGLLRSWGDHLCLDTAHPDKDHGEVHMWDCNGHNSHQKWHIEGNFVGAIRTQGDDPKCLLSAGTPLEEPYLGNCSSGPTATWGIGAIAWELGPVPVKEKGPTLFCWQVVNATSYELAITQEAFKRNTGVFNCEAWEVFSEEKAWILEGVVQTSALPGDAVPLRRQVVIGINWLMNSGTFMRAWKKIVYDGRYQQHDWIVKIDPDASFNADRLRVHMKPKTNQWTGAVYVKNCQLFNSMQGPLEVISRDAMTRLVQGLDTCLQDKTMVLGEDYFLEHCLLRLGVGPTEDWQMLHDNYCGGANAGPWQPMECGNQPETVAFHPLKSTWEYLRCVNAIDPTTMMVQPQIA